MGQLEAREIKPHTFGRDLATVLFSRRRLGWGWWASWGVWRDLPVITINTFFSLSGIDSYIYDGSQGDDYSDEDDYETVIIKSY